MLELFEEDEMVDVLSDVSLSSTKPCILVVSAGSFVLLARSLLTLSAAKTFKSVPP